MSEEWTAEEWTSQPRLRIIVNGAVKHEGDAPDNPAEVVNLVRELARQAGLARFRVTVNGETVGPSGFPDAYARARETGEVTIEINKSDYAG